MDWIHGSYTRDAVARWAAAVLATPYSEEVGQSVADATLQIAYVDALRPHIPIEIWALLKRRPSLPPVSRGRFRGTSAAIVLHIQSLGDIEILTSYFFLVWSEWDPPGSRAGVRASIKEGFCGIGMWCHRKALIGLLDHILGQLDRGLEYFQQHKPGISKYDIEWGRRRYETLKKTLFEVDEEEMKILSRTPQSYFLPTSILKFTSMSRITLALSLVRDFTFEIVYVRHLLRFAINEFTHLDTFRYLPTLFELLYSLAWTY
jgi:hypothetical protein